MKLSILAIKIVDRGNVANIVALTADEQRFSGRDIAFTRDAVQQVFW